jgi:hypothetical protein
VTATGYLDGEVDTSFFLGKDRPQMDLGSDGICSRELPNCGGVTAPATGGTSSYQLALNRAKLAKSQTAKISHKADCDSLLKAVRMTWEDMQAAVDFQDYRDGTERKTLC